MLYALQEIFIGIYRCVNVFTKLKAVAQKNVGLLVPILQKVTSGNVKNAYEIVIGEPRRMKPFGKSSHIWEDNIRMDTREIGCESVDWIHLSQDRDLWRAVVNTVMNFRVS
jgi:hypothetical protein